MRNLVFCISFNGTNYHGWQIQNNALTVQETVQKALLKFFGKLEDIKGCSRTDAGVHAKEYYFNMRTKSELKLNDIQKGVDACLPPDIALISVKEADESFHSRYGAKSKQYEYIIWNSRIKNPFADGLMWHYKYPLDVDKLNRSVVEFEGKQDFTSFCASKSDIQDKVRTIYQAKVKRQDDLVIFSFKGDGFLYNMVRIMVGTLVVPTSAASFDVKRIIEMKDRNKAGKTAPACGLYLKKVWY